MMGCLVEHRPLSLHIRVASPICDHKKKDVTEAIKNLFSDAPLITEMVVVVAKGGWVWGYVTRGKKRNTVGLHCELT